MSVNFSNFSNLVEIKANAFSGCSSLTGDLKLWHVKRIGRLSFGFTNFVTVEAHELQWSEDAGDWEELTG